MNGRAARRQRRLLLAQGFDARFALCERPLIIACGELTLEMLEVQFNAAIREHTHRCR